ncbi:MAG: hypothetical protein ABW060_00090 [Solirubrobacteraceae bacterium]
MAIRRLLDKALEKIDELGERSHQKAMANLTPAERERYEAWEARGEASRNGVPEAQLGDARLTGRVLQGPAGELVHGVVEAPRQAVLDDPAAWERQMLAELAARDLVRAPYLAPGRERVRIMRVATRPGKQVADLAAQLAASGLAGRPDLVHGAYRVPDLISPGRLGGEPLVEWDVVHCADAPLPPAPAPAHLTLDAREGWVLRAPGEPRPLDEDVALDILARAGAGPERTLAIARDVAIEKRGGADESSGFSIDAFVRGVHVLVAADASAAVGAAAAGAPRRLAEGPPDGVVVDVLQWDAIARAVQPVRQQRARIPSPFPYLPLTPQELLSAYLEIVGVASADAYAAQVTHDRRFDLASRSSASGHVRRTGGGPPMPCADGKARERMAGGHHVVVAYRDRPEYAQGRARFDAYAERELCAFLRRALNLRAPVPRPPGRLERTVDRVADVAEFFTMDPSTDDTPPDRARYTALVGP